MIENKVISIDIKLIDTLVNWHLYETFFGCLLGEKFFFDNCHENIEVV